jgi:hypothetical protein
MTHTKKDQPETNDREVRPIGAHEDGTSFTNADNDWPEGTVGPNGRPARKSERTEDD